MQIAVCDILTCCCRAPEQQNLLVTSGVLQVCLKGRLLGKMQKMYSSFWFQLASGISCWGFLPTSIVLPMVHCNDLGQYWWQPQTCVCFKYMVWPLKDERFLKPKNEKKQLSEGNTGGDRSWWRLPPPSVATYWPAVYKRVCIREGHWHILIILLCVCLGSKNK